MRLKLSELMSTCPNIVKSVNGIAIAFMMLTFKMSPILDAAIHHHRFILTQNL